MLDIDAELTKMIAKLPSVPASFVPKDMCDKPFMAPQAPAHYVLKTTKGPADVCSHRRAVSDIVPVLVRR